MTEQPLPPIFNSDRRGNDAPDRTDSTTDDSEEKLRTQRWFPLQVSREHGLGVAFLWAAIARYTPNGETEAFVQDYDEGETFDDILAADLGVSRRTVRRRRRKALEDGAPIEWGTDEVSRRAYRLLYGGDVYVGGNGSFKKHGHYLKIPDVLWESDLSDHAKAVAAYCERLTRRCCWKTIRETLGMSHHRLIDARKELKKREVIDWDAKPGQKPLFSVKDLTDPATFQDDNASRQDDNASLRDDNARPLISTPISTNISTNSVQLSCADRQRRRPALTECSPLFVSEIPDGEEETGASPGAGENDERRVAKEKKDGLQPLRDMVQTLHDKHGVLEVADMVVGNMRDTPPAAEHCDAVIERMLDAYEVKWGGLYTSKGKPVDNVGGLIRYLLGECMTATADGQIKPHDWAICEADNMHKRTTGEVVTEDEEDADCEEVSFPTGTKATAQINMDWESETVDVTAENPPFDPAGHARGGRHNQR